VSGLLKNNVKQYGEIRLKTIETKYGYDESTLSETNIAPENS